MVSRLALTLSLLCVSGYTSHIISAPVPSEQLVNQQEEQRTIHVVNNLSDICMMIEMPDEQLQALEKVIKKATVTINGTTLRDGESMHMAIGQTPVRVIVRLNGQAAEPFLKTTGIANFFFYFVQFEVSFDTIIEEDQDELLSLVALVHKCDQWKDAPPSVTISGRLPMTVSVGVSDFKAA